MWKLLIAVITFLGGLFYIAEFAIPAELQLGGKMRDNPLTSWMTLAGQILTVMAGMAILIGPLNLMKVHLGVLTKRREQPSVIACSAVFVVCFLIGLVAVLPQLSSSVAGNPTNAWNVPYNWLNYGFNQAFGNTSMALLAFYLISAAFRSFRLHSLDAGVMMISALVVLLGLTPIGTWLTHGLKGTALNWLQLPLVTDWILATPNTGVQRAVVFGVCAGAFATGMRHWLSLGAAKAG